MKYNINITREAFNDLDDIFIYISTVLQSPDTAKQIVDEINVGLMSLSKFPERYPTVEAEPWKSKNIRKMPIKNYMIFYYVEKSEALVEIIRIFYARRNIKSIWIKIRPKLI